MYTIVHLYACCQPLETRRGNNTMIWVSPEQRYRCSIGPQNLLLLSTGSPAPIRRYNVWPMEGAHCGRSSVWHPCDLRSLAPASGRAFSWWPGASWPAWSVWRSTIAHAPRPRRSRASSAFHACMTTRWRCSTRSNSISSTSSPMSIRTAALWSWPHSIGCR
jgi:hypothetical protein